MDDLIVVVDETKFCELVSFTSEISGKELCWDIDVGLAVVEDTDDEVDEMVVWVALVFMFSKMDWFKFKVIDKFDVKISVMVGVGFNFNIAVVLIVEAEVVIAVLVIKNWIDVVIGALDEIVDEVVETVDEIFERFDAEFTGDDEMLVIAGVVDELFIIWAVEFSAWIELTESSKWSEVSDAGDGLPLSVKVVEIVIVSVE